MGQKEASAFAGEHRMPNGADRVTVQWFDLHHCRTQINVGITRHDPKWRAVGWFWTAYRGRKPSAAAIWHGPYTASGVALKAATALFPPEPREPRARRTVTATA